KAADGDDDLAQELILELESRLLSAADLGGPDPDDGQRIAQLAGKKSDLAPVLEGHLAAVNAEVATKYEAYTLVKPAKPMPEWSIDEFHDALPAVRDLVVAVLERELVRDDIALEQK